MIELPLLVCLCIAATFLLGGVLLVADAIRRLVCAVSEESPSVR